MRNIPFGGAIGLLIVYFLSGANGTLGSEDVNLILEKRTARLPGDQRVLSVFLFEDVPYRFRDKMVGMERR